jgi:hypothetical protein
MSDRKTAAITHFAVGGLTVALGLKNLVAPGEHYTSMPIWNDFLFRYGGPISSFLIGGFILALGFLTQRANDPAESTRELNFVYEAEIPLAPLASVFLFWIGIMSATAILPYTGERGIEPGQLVAVAFLIPMMLGGAWFFLHYRRLAIVDSATRTLIISYGKPWAVFTRRAEFSDFQTVAIEEVQRARGSVYRIVASGPRGSRLITFIFSRDSAQHCVQNIVHVTGWAEAALAKA